jgi:hypothetical protein
MAGLRFWTATLCHAVTKAVIMRNLTIPLVLLLSFVGCDQQPTAPVGEETPALNWMNNPDIENFRIDRFVETEQFAVSWTDPKNGLRATHTNFPIPFMGAPETDCGPQSPRVGLLEVQDVGLIDAFDLFASQIRRNLRGSLWVIIRDVTQAGTCYGNKLIAEGLGEMHYIDSDLFGVGPEGENANAWGFAGSGTLTKVGGGTLSYTGHARFTVVIKPEQDPVFTHEQSIVNVR